MSKPTLQAQIDAANVYEALFVPALFGQWAPKVAESFEAVVSQFGLMFFTDRRKAVREMLRVLTPGGRLSVAVWDSLDNIPVYASERGSNR